MSSDSSGRETLTTSAIIIVVVLFFGIIIGMAVHQSGAEKRKLTEATEFYSCRMEKGPQGDC